MTHNEFVRRLAQATGRTEANVKLFLADLTEELTSLLMQGDTVVLRNLATFSTRERAARTYNNPVTGGEVHKPATIMPVVKTSGVLKRRVAEQ